MDSGGCQLVIRTLLVLIVLWTELCCGIKWLALQRNKQKAWTDATDCSKAMGLTSQQIKFCQEHLDLMPTVSIASFKGIDACQRQFSDRRWNCSSITKTPKLTKDLKRGTREQAFVYALSSASLMHSIARACSVGITSRCACGTLPTSQPTGDFKWGGCGDDTEYGLRFSQSFTAYHKYKDDTRKKIMMNSHNSNAGNMVVLASLTTACKCHGVSGSCSIKTCWKSLTDFNRIAEKLKNKYGMAIEVKRRRKKNVSKFVPINKNLDSIPNVELVYIKKSPDYCSYDRKLGAPGTRGRTCDPESNGPGGCDIMCCGRGFDSQDVQIVERCECKYYWCCYVKCKTCSKWVRLHRCR